jgi:hypothetical protein
MARTPDPAASPPDAGALRSLLRAVRRRLRLAWSLATAQRWLPGVVGAALVLVAAGRWQPWAWPEPTALGLVAAAVLALAGATVALRVPVTVAARAADRGLATGDAFASALQFRASASAFAPRVAARADGIARTASPRDAVPLRPSWRAWAIVAVLGALALGAALAPNDQDAVRARHRDERAQIATEAEKLRDLAADLRGRPDVTAEQRALADRLDEVAQRIEQAETAAAAAEELRRTAPELATMGDAELLARSTAARGLDQALAGRPLPGASGGSAADQLAQAGGRVGSLSAGERADLARRLGDLADSQAGDPELADALRDAAGDLDSGDTAGAAEALERASKAQRSSQRATRGEADRRAAADALDDAGDRLAGAAPGAGQGSGPSSGQGQGQGEGQGGKGQGGSGAGGAGQGRGPGGNGTDPGKPGSGASGGPTSGGPSDVPPPGAGPPDPRASSIYTPPAGDNQSIQADGRPTAGQPGDVVGRVAGPNAPGRANTPVGTGDVAGYAQEATRAMDDTGVSPSQKAQVLSYFDEINARLAGRP